MCILMPTGGAVWLSSIVKSYIMIMCLKTRVLYQHPEVQVIHCHCIPCACGSDNLRKRGRRLYYEYILYKIHQLHDSLVKPQAPPQGWPPHRSTGW